MLWRRIVRLVVRRKPALRLAPAALLVAARLSALRPLAGEGQGAAASERAGPGAYLRRRAPLPNPLPQAGEGTNRVRSPSRCRSGWRKPALRLAPAEQLVAARLSALRPLAGEGQRAAASERARPGAYLRRRAPLPNPLPQAGEGTNRVRSPSYATRCRSGWRKPALRLTPAALLVAKRLSALRPLAGEGQGAAASERARPGAYLRRRAPLPNPLPQAGEGWGEGHLLGF